MNQLDSFPNPQQPTNHPSTTYKTIYKKKSQSRDWHRLTRVQLLFTRNPYPASVFKVRSHLNICYYHQDLHLGLFWLPSRAKAFLTEAQRPPTRDRLQKYSIKVFVDKLFRKKIQSRPGIGRRAWAPSIFRAGPFGRWVVTHSLAGFDFHDHRPAVRMDRHLLWVLEWARSPAP